VKKIAPNFRMNARSTEHFGLSTALEEAKHNGMKSSESVSSISKPLSQNNYGLIQGLTLSKQIIRNNALTVYHRLNSSPLDA
jgi:hypothetical protein